MVECAPAHVGERGDLDDAALAVLLDVFGGHHVVQRVEERAEVRIDLLVEIAGQKAERFAGLDGGAGEDDARNLLLAERGDGHRHCQISLARAGGTDAQAQVVRANGFDIFLLADGLGDDVGFLARGLDAFGVEVFERGDTVVLDDAQCVGKIASTHRMAGLERGFENLEQLLGAVDGFVGTFELDPAFAGGGFDAKDLFQGVKRLCVVVEELLGEARVLEVKSFGGH